MRSFSLFQNYFYLVKNYFIITYFYLVEKKTFLRKMKFLYAFKKNSLKMIAGVLIIYYDKLQMRNIAKTTAKMSIWYCSTIYDIKQPLIAFY